MCAIAGILGKVDERNKRALRRMADAMKHRGPNGEGFWTGRPDRQGNGCMLAHRRLSILDLSTHASQPMIDRVSGKVIVFNGELYNFQELRERLQGEGETFASTGDTAVLLRAVAKQGAEALKDLRGMFAFGLWDDDSRELMLVRDPLGIKPLYVCRQSEGDAEGWSLMFASEVRAILASGLLSRPKLSREAVASVVWNGFVAGPYTAVEGIESLWPGQAVTLNSLGVETQSKMYWDLPDADTPRNMSEPELAEAIEESVRLHMVSDVPLGVFLSSGVDSSAMANLAQKSSPRRVKTFTLAFEEEELNEGKHAWKIADAIGTEHHEILLTEDRFVGQLGNAMDSLDQPTFDGLNSYYISRAVVEAGLTVALIGTGGDELFGGYSSFRHLPRLHRLSTQTSWLPEGMKGSAARAVMAVANRSSAAVAPQTRWAKLPDMLDDGEDLLALYQLGYALFLPDFQEDLLGSDSPSILRRGLPEALYKRVERESAGRNSLEALSIMETRLFLGERLLRDTDAASMAVSLEVRLPLVDSVLLEQLAHVPTRDRYQPVGSKSMLRRIGLRGLDPALFQRPKSGFVLPFDRWISGNLGKEMDHVMRDESAAARVGLNGKAVSRLWNAYQQKARGMYWSRVWALYVLIRWCHQHGVLA